MSSDLTAKHDPKDVIKLADCAECQPYTGPKRPQHPRDDDGGDNFGEGSSRSASDGSGGDNFGEGSSREAGSSRQNSDLAQADSEIEGGDKEPTVVVGRPQEQMELERPAKQEQERLKFLVVIGAIVGLAAIACFIYFLVAIGIGFPHKPVNATASAATGTNVSNALEARWEVPVTSMDLETLWTTAVSDSLPMAMATRRFRG